MAMKRTNKITNKQILSWARGVEAWTAQRAKLDATKENKKFHMIKKADLNDQKIKTKWNKLKKTKQKPTVKRNTEADLSRVADTAAP